MVFKGRKSTLIIVLCIILFSGWLLFFLGSQKEGIPNDPNFYHGSWIGATIQIDQDVYFPHTSILRFEEHEQLKVINIETSDTHSLTWNLQTKGLQIDTTLYDESQMTVSGNVLSLSRPYARTYFKPTYVRLSKSRIQIRNMLRGSTWSTNAHKYYFKEDGRILIQNHSEEIAHSYCWRIGELEGLIFLMIYGNHSDCDGMYHHLRQIIAVNEHSVEIQYYENTECIKEILTKIDEDEEAFTPSTFQLCNKFLYRNLPHHRYYYKNTRLHNGHAQIWKKLKEGYAPPVSGADVSGHVRIRFVVNCEGKTGMFEALELDLDYNKSDIDDAVTDQLMQITQDLGPWQPGKHSHSSHPIDTYYFITYRIKNGEVVEIFP